MNPGIRQALVALEAFAEATRRQYVENLELFHMPGGGLLDPLAKSRPYASDLLATAQSYKEKGEDRFVTLAHLEGADVGFVETEALVWLGNDATVFDVTIRNKQMRADDRMMGLGQLHGERTVARAIFLRCLLGGYVRAHDANLFQRAMNKEQGVREVAQALVKQSVQEFEASMKLYAKTVAFQREVIAFAQTMEFPLIPMPIGHDAKTKEMFNGVALTPELAEQMRTHFAQLKNKREKR